MSRTFGPAARPSAPVSTTLEFPGIEGRLRPLLRGAAELAELEALLRENDPELRLRAWCDFAGRLEADARFPAAAELYAALISATPDGSPEAARLRERLAALRGEGALAPRCEALLRRFSREACDPVSLAAMGVAGSVYRLARAGILSRLLAAPATHPLARGFGARALAATAAFALEAPAFTLSGHAVSGLIGRERAAGDGALLQEIASSYLFLGGMKLAGWASGGLHASLAAPHRWGGGALRLGLQQGGMFGGILLGHWLERVAGLKAPRSGEAPWLESLALLLQFHVGGHLTGRLLGTGLRAHELALEAAPRVGPEGPVGLGPRGPALARAGAAAAADWTPAPRAAEQLLAMSRSREGATGRPPRVPSFNELGTAVAALRGLRSLPRHHLPYDDFSFHLRFARVLQSWQLLDNAHRALERARELALGLDHPPQAAEALGQTGEALAAIGHHRDAREAFAEALRRVERVAPSSQPHLLGALWRRQRAAGDPAAAKTLWLAQAAADRETARGNPASAEHLAIQVAAAGHLSLGRRLIDTLPEGHRVYALTELALQWTRAGEEHPTIARALFHEARAEVERGLPLRDANFPVHALTRLAKKLHEAGPDYREDAYDATVALRDYLLWCFSGTAFFANQTPELAGLLARAHRFQEAADFLRRESRDPAHRSAGFAKVVVELGRAGRFSQADALLRRERLLAGDRFSALLGLAELHREKRGAWTPEGRRLLREARDLILLHEFPRGLPTRAEGLARLARAFVEAGERATAAGLYEAAREAVAQDTMISPETAGGRFADLALARAEGLGFSRIPRNRPRLFETLRRAVAKGEMEKVARLATVLGFCEDGLEYGREQLAALPEDYRLWTLVHLYEGASLAPRDAAGRAELAAELGEIFQASFASRAPLAPRVHRRAAQLLQRLDPGAWLRAAHEQVRLALGPASVGLGIFAWESERSRFVFAERDPFLYQNLFWLSRSRHGPSQALVRDLMRSPSFPPPWREVLSRALRRSGDSPGTDSKKLLN